MTSKRSEEVRDYAFADQALALRKRTGLTQRELAEALGVTTQSIHTWEGGLSYPGAERLRQLIAFYLEHGVLEPGREAEEAEALWETVRQRATRRIEPFDPAWFPVLPSSQAPVLRPAERPPTNLPPARSSFIGRAEEVQRLAQVLAADPRAGANLLTLTGIAGSGKTRLALTVAEVVLGAYPDGVWFVELAPLPAGSGADPTPIAMAVLAALRLHEQPGQMPLESLTDHLTTRRLLLVLDNCEHVVAACAALTAHVLVACPQVQILTTSQYPLGIPPEMLWQVDALGTPAEIEGSATPELLEVLRTSEAVQLFVERAREARPGFELDLETAAAVTTICRKLDGLPLAIELAAARLNMLSVDDLLARLNSRFTLLRRGGRTVVDRHQTLQATMDWSYRLLEPSDQAVLRRLAVFSGGWEVPAAEEVCSGELVSTETVLEALDELLARSLVHVYLADGVPRYGMLETVRQYGLQHLHLTGELASTRDRHLNWCLTLAEQAAITLQGEEQGVWLARLNREHDNLRAAAQWTLDRGLGTEGLRVAGLLAKFWLRGGHQREGREWLAALLELPHDEDDSAAVAVRATALEAAAWLADDEHDFAQASTLFAESGTLRRSLGQEDSPVARQVSAGLAARSEGDYDRATTLLEDALAQHRRIGNQEISKQGNLGLAVSVIFPYTLCALVLREQGKFEPAELLCQEALALSEQRGDTEGRASVLLTMADIARDQGDSVRVRTYAEESLALFRELGHPWAIGFAHNNLALAALQEGDTPLAMSHAKESEAIYREMQAGPSLAEVLVTVGRIRGVLGESEEARASLVEALELASQEGPQLIVALSLEALAVEAARQGHAEYAVYLLSATAELRRTMGTPVWPVDRAELDGVLEEARCALGTEAFADAWDKGRTLSIEQMVGWGRGLEVAQG